MLATGSYPQVRFRGVKLRIPENNKEHGTLASRHRLNRYLGCASHDVLWQVYHGICPRQDVAFRRNYVA